VKASRKINFPIFGEATACPNNVKPTLSSIASAHDRATLTHFGHRARIPQDSVKFLPWWAPKTDFSEDANIAAGLDEFGLVRQLASYAANPGTDSTFAALLQGLQYAFREAYVPEILQSFYYYSGTGIYSPASRHGPCLKYPSGSFQLHVFCIEHSPQINRFLQVAGGNNFVALSLHEHAACIGPAIVFPWSTTWTKRDDTVCQSCINPVFDRPSWPSTQCSDEIVRRMEW